MPTISIDGNTFTTIEEFIEYLQETYGANWEAQEQSLLQWGKTLDANVSTGTGLLYRDGVRDFGSIGQVYIDKGWMNTDYMINYDSYYGVMKQYGTATHAEIAKDLLLQEATYGSDTYYVNSIPLGKTTPSSAPANTFPTLSQTATSANGQTQTATCVMTEEKIPDPTVPGTFSYIGTLAALGWLPLPAWVAAAAPLLGVGLGFAINDLAPEFWEDLSRRVAPFAYSDFDPETYYNALQMPFALDKDGLIYTSLKALGILRDAFIEAGVYSSGEIEIVPSELPDIEHPENYSSPFVFYENGTFYNLRPNGDVYTYELTSHTDPVYIAQIKYNDRTKTDVFLCSESPFQYTRYFEGEPVGVYTSTTITVDGETYYYLFNSSVTPESPSSDWEYYMDSAVTNYIYTSSNTSNAPDLIRMALNATGGGGVEGTTLEEGATYPTDTTKSLAEIYPQWASGAISVITDPSADTFEDGTEEWYPMSLANTNYSCNPEVTSSTQTQQQAQSGSNTDPSQLAQILEGIQNLPDILNRDGLIPDTVPTNPPSTEPTPSPTPPVITGAGSDLISIYNPTKAQIQAFNQFLWDLDPTNLVNWQKVIQNPIDAIISLHMIYVTPITGEPQHIKCGYIETDVSSKIVTNQYVDIDCGTVDVNEYFHNVWDYIATDIQIYLPFIGIVPLHVSDIMNSTIRVKYRVDVYTGTCLAQIIVYKENSFAVLYTYTGNCAVSLPLSGGSFSNIMSTLIVMGGLVMSGNAGTAATYAMGRASRGELMQHIQRSGNIGANAGAMGIRTPYLIITRKKPLDAYLYQEQYGFPANKTVVLGDMSGYTRVKNIHLHGIPCTDDELEMIERLLKDGVIIN